MATRIVTARGVRPVTTAKTQPAVKAAVPSQLVCTLDNSMLHALMARPDMLRRFPFLQAFASQIKASSQNLTGTCKPCEQKRRAAKHLEDLKATIAGLPPAAQTAFREAIPAAKVRFNFVNASGRSQRAEF